MKKEREKGFIKFFKIKEEEEYQLYKNKFKKKKGKKSANNCQKIKSNLNSIIIFILLVISLIGIFFLFIFKFFNNKESKLSIINPSILIKEEITDQKIIKEKKEEIKKVNLYIRRFVQNYSKIGDCPKSDNPKISIIIRVYNDGKNLKRSLKSIQSQNLKDIEIIIVNDHSTDNSENVVKELMEKEHRITLYSNEENKGALYSKTRGVLNAKGKYVMILENKDIYLQEDAFTTLFEEAEKNNLEILGFAAIIEWGKNIAYDFFKEKYIHHFIETPLIFIPNITEKMYLTDNNGKIHRTGDVIFNYLFNTEFFIKTIKQIDEKYLNQKMNYHEDFLMFFLLTRNAKNFKNIKKIFYYSSNDKEKNIEDKNLACLNYLNYANFLLDKTSDSISDKKIASYELENWYFNNNCKNNEVIKDEAINITKVFSENRNIEDEMKNKIFLFMFENVTHISK